MKFIHKIWFSWLIATACFVAPDEGLGQLTEGDPKEKLEVKYFLTRSEFVNSLASSLGKSYLEIVDSQHEKIKELIAQYEKEMKRVSGDEKLSYADRLEKLKSLRIEMTNEVKKELLPHQINRMQHLRTYSLILEDGWANSIHKGKLALELGLSKKERDEFKAVADEVLNEYVEAVENAQKKALKKLKKSLPNPKQKELTKLEELFFNARGIFWSPRKFHLETSRSARSSYLLQK